MEDRVAVSPDNARKVADKWFHEFYGGQDSVAEPNKMNFPEFKMFLAQYPAIVDAFQNSFHKEIWCNKAIRRESLLVSNV
jgi:hypothetical protein